LEYTLKNIISLDKRATEYKDSLDKKLSEEKKEFQAEISRKDKEFSDSLQQEKDQIINKYLRDAEKSAADIRKNGDAQLNLLRQKYESSKNEIIEKIFSALLKKA
jgi:uncharacterized protein with gpF-like domain